MSRTPREALNALILALEQHFDLASNSDVVQQSVLEDSEDRLRDAFFTYDDVLFTEFEAELPFEILDDDFDDDDDDDDDNGHDDDDEDDIVFESSWD